ncbi:MAG: hypothetical protein WBD40_18585 [Tepidisphaeraceae bacterium]
MTWDLSFVQMGDPMEQPHREMIGRATMLLSAVALLAASAWVMRIGWQVTVDEAAQRAELRRTNPSAKSTAYGNCFLIGAAAIGLAGLYLLKLALLSHRNLDKNPPKAPILWDNPEPGGRFWRGPR